MRSRIVNPSRYQMPNEPVSVEFDGKNGRETKTFPNALKARTFWLKADRDGLHPRIVKEVK